MLKLKSKVEEIKKAIHSYDTKSGMFGIAKQETNHHIEITSSNY